MKHTRKMTSMNIYLQPGYLDSRQVVSYTKVVSNNQTKCTINRNNNKKTEMNIKRENQFR